MNEQIKEIWHYNSTDESLEFVETNPNNFQVHESTS